MSDLKLSDEQWEVIALLLPAQPRTGRRRKHDRQVLNSLVYRLKMGVRYKDIPRSESYAAKSTVYHWLRRWSEEGVLEEIWRRLLSLLEAEGGIDLSEGSLDGSFVAAKRGAKRTAYPSRFFSKPPTLTSHNWPGMCWLRFAYPDWVKVAPKLAFLRWRWTRRSTPQLYVGTCASAA